MRCGLAQCTILEDESVRNATHFKSYAVNTNLTVKDEEFTQHVVVEEYGKLPSENEWMQDSYKDPEATFVDLLKNPERFSGYNGSNIWNQIYMENLDKMKFSTKGNHEKFLYKLISGIHTNVNMHISKYYHDDDETGYRPNRRLFYERVGKFPERVDSLYYTMVFLLDVLSDISPILPKYTFDTLNKTENTLVKNKMKSIAKSIKDLPAPVLIEKGLFSTVQKDQLRVEIKPTFQNITRLLDCVGCNV